MMGRARFLAVATVAATAAELVAIALLDRGSYARHASQSADAWLVVPAAVAVLAPSLVGLRIAWAQPTNRIGWILIAGPLIEVLPFLVSAYAVNGVAVHGGDRFALRWAVVLTTSAWPLIFAWPVAIGFLFPTGSALSVWWRRAGIAACVNALVFMCFGILGTSFEAPFEHVSNPLFGHGPVPGPAVVGDLWVLPWIGMLATLVAAGASAVVRLRRSRGVERLQMLWLAWAAALLPIALVPILLAGYFVPAVSDLDVPVLVAFEIAIAVAIGIAILRYRLYAIERIVNRTVVYVLLTAVLVGTFTLVALGAGLVLGRGSAAATAVATLAAAVVFAPVRRRLQAAVDRRFSRERHRSLALVQAFELAVRSGHADAEGIEDVLRDALHDPGARVLYLIAGADEPVDRNGHAATPTGSAAPISHRGQVIALLVPGGPGDPLQAPDVQTAVLDASALTVEIARLRIDLRLSLAEVDESRRRLVEATYEERRRLERDLHDGAQQRLVSLGLQLRRLQRSLPGDARVLEPALERAVDEIAVTIADLRAIAAGVRPPRLDDGLRTALAELVRNAPVPVELDLPGERFPPQVEEAAFYVASEAITNAVKHASPTRVRVHGVRRDSHLCLTIDDDGVGGARAGPGSGLLGLTDRVQAHGGRLRLVSPPGRGTLVEVELPCGS
jgi:signal transduction histidine kinase